ncbi:MAG: endonuclease MutS2 [Chloroflexi bacterium]|nr:endonuclease MutS2 [Chloroflexota bacterium]
MNEKSANILELPKILEKLAQYTSFSGGRELALNLTPTPDLSVARELQRETTEARALLLAKPETHMGGVTDVREAALSCRRGFVLEASTLLNIRSTLRRATNLKRTVGKLGSQFPLLSAIVDTLEECTTVQNEIGRVLDDTGMILDSASVKLATIRRELRISFDRLHSKITNIATSQANAKYLQEPIVTQRNGRYVIPLKAEHKGRIPGVVHDQSSSGATLFIEPLSTVELNNRYRELQIEEENEIRRILAALSEMVGESADKISHTVEVLAYLDLVFARAKYAESLDATEPHLVPFRTDMANPRHPGGTIQLLNARHPLLDQQKVVPTDVELDDNTFMLIITGPNTGGKTVALKTMGLMTLMAQCGLHLPAAQGTTLSVFEDVYADIGDEQSIEQSLSTFSSHMTNIIQILKWANPRSLVILDELGAGTDPAEGSALARSLLIHFLERGVTTIVTTHHPELKAFGYERPGVRNASVEFDLETLAPTYRLMVGIPGRSNALAIASRLGLPADIIEQARGMVATEDLKVDDLLDEIQKTRDEIRHLLSRKQEEEAEIDNLRLELVDRVENIEHERRKILAEAREQAEADLEDLRREVRRMQRQLEGAGQPLDAIRQLAEQARTITPADYLKTPDPVEKPTNGDVQQFRLDEMVWLPNLKAEGKITEITSDEIEVLVGRLRIRAKPSELERRTAKERKKEKRTAMPELYDGPSTQFDRGKSPGLELDLRGSRIEDAVPQVESYVDAAYMAGLPFVRVIHGKGTGALRKAIREELSRHPLVSKHMSGNDKEGGEGVTIVHLVSQH